MTNVNNRDEQAAQLAKSLGITAEHIPDMMEIQDYFKEHKINELLNELMTNVI